MSSSNIEFKMRYNPQMHIFMQRAFSNAYQAVLYLNNAKKQEVQVLLQEWQLRTDEHFMHVHISKMQVLEEQYSLRDLYCWRDVVGIKLLGGEETTAAPDKVFAEYAFNVRRGWFKRFINKVKWALL